jgi:hypothetical protein
MYDRCLPRMKSRNISFANGLSKKISGIVKEKAKRRRQRSQ